ncbi:ABC transporter substrate-binding protein [Rhodalgimonas zhirmunskyi]|uniref:ABC transporter substrate-binding protein n=1 Tax=Rhodalgimonas zhirmunskyi TaxID=2964767 RepID=A0AAJ1UBX8_9RHOB|nr:ABC transporter substrate-binding protein [Rhodoalgimonas zhirmunskyi]MDQ2093362.1 ABC transporter substrate-binding protein [Rhodoalgimonas zhirmunskyi]
MLDKFFKGAATAAAFSLATALPAGAVDLQFYFPVAVGGGAANTIEALSNAYMEANPDVKIDPVYSGSYQDTITKVITAARGGNAPQLAVALSVDMFTLLDDDLILPFDDFLETDADMAWVNGFYPAFMENSQVDGKTYGIPFQRSTPVLYWNKEAFKEAGLDPETPPATWDEMVEMGKALTKTDASGNTTQWGVRIPTSGFPYWLFQGLVIENGGTLANAEGTETYFDSAPVIEAAQYLVDLSTKHKVMEPGILDWGATPKDFFEGRSAMVWTTTGNLTNMRNNAPFDFGVAMLPANMQRGAPTGGGNFYLFKGTSDEQLAAAVDFIKWITAPEQAAKWTMATGYVAPRPATWETQTMKDYAAGFPQVLTARDQLEHAKAELSTHENQRVTQILNDALAAAITGQKPVETALKEAQAKADAVLKAYR